MEWNTVACWKYEKNKDLKLNFKTQRKNTKGICLITIGHANMWNNKNWGEFVIIDI